MTNFLNKSLAVKTETVRCTANQTKKAEANKKSPKVKNQDERKASTNLLAFQEHIPMMWEHGSGNRSENRSSAVQSKPDQKKATASQASKRRSGKNSPEETAADSRDSRQQRNKAKTLKKHFVITQKKTSDSTQDARSTSTQRATPPGAKTPPSPPPKPPPQNTNRPTPNFGISSGTMPWNSGSMEHFAMDTRMKLRYEWRQKRSK